jgi:hypothetical protein
MKGPHRGHDLLSENQHLKKMLPQTRKNRNQLIGIVGLLLGTSIAVIGLFYLKQRNSMTQENWATAVATIEDTRTRLVGRTDSIYGGRMLYEVQVLAAFTVNGSHQERWISVEQPPKTLAGAQFEEAHWKSTQCIVRWNPSNPQQIAVELHRFPELR